MLLIGEEGGSGGGGLLGGGGLARWMVGGFFLSSSWGLITSEVWSETLTSSVQLLCWLDTSNRPPMPHAQTSSFGSAISFTSLADARLAAARVF